MTTLIRLTTVSLLSVRKNVLNTMKKDKYKDAIHVFNSEGKKKKTGELWFIYLLVAS